jgi:DNA invertase Pin-like site-specific DNA recombinase
MGLELNRNAGIYCRLSDEDERLGESVSIENQRDLLRKYVAEQGWNEIDVYVDDGYSGVNFERPAVKRLIEDAKSGRINIIVVKDLSRFGRNYIEIGQYTDYLFPTIGCRFIALGNSVDTSVQSASNDMMGFLNLFNEFHSRDTSKKVRAVKKAYAEQGKYLAAIAPIGYKRREDDKNSLEIDEDTAPIVRRIFNMRASGQGYHAIALALNADGVPIPLDIHYAKKGKPNPNRCNHQWSGSGVKQIIRNEIYIGNMVNGKSGTISFKNKKLRQNPKDEWIRVEGTHEAIISREVWDLCAALDKERYQKQERADQPASVLTGLVRCADCGTKMHVRRGSQTMKNGNTYRYSYFGCGSYRKSGITACTPHSIREEILLELVLADIRGKAAAVKVNEKAIAKQIIRLKNTESDSRLAGYEKELKAALARLPETERLMMSLYEDRIKGALPETVFATLMKKYEAQQSELNAQIPLLGEKINGIRMNVDNTALWIAHIKKYFDIQTADEAILVELIDHIEVGDPHRENGVTVCDVRVIYRYVGDVDAAVTSAMKEAA